MSPLLTIQNITFATGCFMMIFSVYRYFRDPQVTLDKQQTLDRIQVDDQNKLLGIQVTADRNATDRRFSEMSQRLDTGMTLAQNHIHTVDVKVDNLKDMVNSMNLSINKELVALTTIINERIPLKK